VLKSTEFKIKKRLKDKPNHAQYEIDVIKEELRNEQEMDKNIKNNPDITIINWKFTELRCLFDELNITKIYSAYC